MTTHRQVFKWKPSKYNKKKRKKIYIYILECFEIGHINLKKDCETALSFAIHRH